MRIERLCEGGELSPEGSVGVVMCERWGEKEYFRVVFKVRRVMEGSDQSINKDEVSRVMLGEGNVRRAMWGSLSCMSNKVVYHQIIETTATPRGLGINSKNTFINVKSFFKQKNVLIYF